MPGGECLDVIINEVARELATLRIPEKDEVYPADWGLMPLPPVLATPNGLAEWRVLPRAVKMLWRFSLVLLQGLTGTKRPITDFAALTLNVCV